MRRAPVAWAPAVGGGAGRVAEAGGADVGTGKTFVGAGADVGATVDVGTAVPVKDGSGKGVGATKIVGVGAAN
jgi:hypothetical protein